MTRNRSQKSAVLFKNVPERYWAEATKNVLEAKLVKFVEVIVSLGNNLDRIRDLAQQGNEEAAFIQINGLINEYPYEAEAWSLRGSLYERLKVYDEALTNFSRAIDLSPEEAIFYFHRGRCNLKSGNTLGAVQDLSDALMKDKRGDTTFTEALYFHRAEAFIKLRKKAEALSDLSYIPESYKMWTFKLRSKEDMLEDCNSL